MIANASAPPSFALSAARRTERDGDESEGVEIRERLSGLFESHHERLFRIAIRMTGDREEAKDLVQDCFVRIARSSRRVPGSESGAEAWLVKTLINLCRDRRRRRWVRERHATFTRPREPQADHQGSTVARLSLARALDALSARRRAVVVLRELEGLEVVEVARQLGISRATVRWHLSRARAELRAVLSGLDPEGEPE